MIAVRMARAAGVLSILILLTLMIGPFGGLESSTGVSDKVGHIAGFAVIAISVAVLFPRWSLWRIAAASLATGIGIEIIQGFVGRDADVMDVAADLVGIFLACLALGIAPSTPFRTKPS